MAVTIHEKLVLFFILKKDSQYKQSTPQIAEFVIKSVSNLEAPVRLFVPGHLEECS